MEIPKTFLGYKREDGRSGTRNHVIILPVDDISNACAEAVANNIKGTIALPHSYGRLQFGADPESSKRMRQRKKQLQRIVSVNLFLWVLSKQKYKML